MSKTITIGPVTFDCTQREVVADIAVKIYAMMGFTPVDGDTLALFDSRNPIDQNIIATAEQIFEIFWGDSPDYEDDRD